MKNDLKSIWILAGLAVLFAGTALLWVARAIASEARSQTPAPAETTVHAFRVKDIRGGERDLSGYQGKVLLIVNTASRCGFTPQYSGLQKLHERYRERGFEVLAFPANNFMGQEPGSDKEIQEFCSLKFGVTFPLFSKISVKGGDIHPLFRFLTTRPGLEGEVSWNFNKFLIGPDGAVVARFGSRQDPAGAELTGAIEALLPDTSGSVS
jgi:glutathione peroxidase